ncbi:MAG: hypothetical protein AAFY73_00535 [Pseudomonadota bacterium]
MSNRCSIARPPPKLNSMASTNEIAARHDWPHHRRLQNALARQTGDGLAAQKVVRSCRFIEDQVAAPEEFLHLSGQWSDFAAQTLDTALADALQSASITKISLCEPVCGTVPGLFILGLGKLGGRDLNYSSDVDLVAFFDPETVPVPAHEGRTYVCDMVLKAMTTTIAGRTDTDRIWRVDWRLRPDPSVTGLSMATDAALEFFAFRSAPWRRLAMMKARVVAGDQTAGEAFLKRLSAFVWRRTLDFRTLDEIAAVKERIKNEHPGLAATGPAATDIGAADEFHIKLGSGGIRETEFIVNAQQLIWGGRQTKLRTTNTIDALEQCAALGHLAEDDAPRLKQAYIWLRRLENCVQMIADRQVHTIPDPPEERALIVDLMGLESWTELTAALREHRSFVADRFARFLVEDSGDSEPPQNPQLSKISAQAEAIVETWQGGFLAYGATPDQNLQGLESALMHSATRQEDVDAAVSQIDGFLKALPRGGQYLRLLASDAKLTGRIFDAFLRSEPTASLMYQSPHVVDVLLERGGDTQAILANANDLPQQLANQIGQEAQLEWLRSWTNERLFLSYLTALSGGRATREIAHDIAATAEQALHLATIMTCEHMKLEGSPVSTVGFGRLGMDSMHPLSDLDLLFLAEADDADALEQANRFSLRLKSNLDTHMKAGRVWEIDMRLRPSGRAGPPTLRPTSLRTHQLERAKTWEHVALVPARFICGSEKSQAIFNETRREVLATPRDQEQLARDASSMLALLREERISPRPDDPYEVKLITGGLMEAEFLLHVLVLRHAASHPSLAHLNYGQLASALADIDAEAAALSGALETLNDMQFSSRLHGQNTLHDRYSLKDWQKRRDAARTVVIDMIQSTLPPLKATKQPDVAVRWQSS